MRRLRWPADLRGLAALLRRTTAFTLTAAFTLTDVLDLVALLDLTAALNLTALFNWTTAFDLTWNRLTAALDRTVPLWATHEVFPFAGDMNTARHRSRSVTVVSRSPRAGSPRMCPRSATAL